jgi:large-conductance mechanosensitive channel
MRGNALDLAVAVTIGAVFGKVITSRTNHEGLSILLSTIPIKATRYPYCTSQLEVS